MHVPTEDKPPQATHTQECRYTVRTIHKWFVLASDPGDNSIICKQECIPDSLLFYLFVQNSTSNPTHVNADLRFSRSLDGPSIKSLDGQMEFNTSLCFGNGNLSNLKEIQSLPANNN